MECVFSDGAWTHILFSSDPHCCDSNVVYESSVACDSNVACNSNVGIIFKHILYVTRKLLLFTFSLCTMAIKLDLSILVASCYLYCLTEQWNVLNIMTLQIHLKYMFTVMECKITVSFILQKTHVSEEMGEI